jgi:hypothetical protein
MKVIDCAKKIAKLLYKQDYDGSVSFDHGSYDFEYEIPYLYIDSKKTYIESFHINEDGNEIKIVDEFGYSHIFDLYMVIDEYLVDIGMIALLIDVYYSTDWTDDFDTFINN